MKIVKAEIVADYFLSLTEPDAGDFLSNHQLQKLLYYAQGFHLAVFGKPLFNDDILAWHQGPVIEPVYRRYEFAGPALPLPTELYTEDLHTIQIGLLNNIYSSFGQFSAWKLRNMTHHEPPYELATPGGVIAHQSLVTYFKTQIEEEED